MKFTRNEANCSGIRIACTDDQGREIGHAFLFVMRNDLHDRPFGLMEDVHVEEDRRGQGIGSLLVHRVIAAARELNCYKLIATSRNSRDKVHRLYQTLGFTSHGQEFRIDL